MNSFNLGKKDRDRDTIRWEQSLRDWHRLLSDPYAIASFKAKLSVAQAKSWNLLRNWWNGEYSSNSWQIKMDQWEEKTENEAKRPQLSAIGDPAVVAYHWCLWVLFIFEMLDMLITSAYPTERHKQQFLRNYGCRIRLSASDCAREIVSMATVWAFVL